MQDALKKQFEAEAEALSNRVWNIIFAEIRVLLKEHREISEFCYSMGGFDFELVDGTTILQSDVVDGNSLDDVLSQDIKLKLKGIFRTIEWALDPFGYPDSIRLTADSPEPIES